MYTSTNSATVRLYFRSGGAHACLFPLRRLSGERPRLAARSIALGPFPPAASVQGEGITSANLPPAGLPSPRIPSPVVRFPVDSHPGQTSSTGKRAASGGAVCQPHPQAAALRRNTDGRALTVWAAWQARGEAGLDEVFTVARVARVALRDRTEPLRSNQQRLWHAGLRKPSAGSRPGMAGLRREAVAASTFSVIQREYNYSGFSFFDACASGDRLSPARGASGPDRRPVAISSQIDAGRAPRQA